MQSQALTNQNQAQYNHTTSQAITKIEIQLDQIAAIVRGKEKGQFPSQIVTNPKGHVPSNVPTCQFEIGPGSINREVQTIHTLRSGKRVDDQVQIPPTKSHTNVETSNKEKEKEVPKESTKKDDKVVDTREKYFVPKAPFPQRLQPSKKKNHCKKILKVFKSVQINISFLDAVNQIPSYAKFLKDLTIIKRKLLFLVKQHLLHKHHI